MEMREAISSDQKWVAKLFDQNKEILGNFSGGTMFYRWKTGGNPREHLTVIPELAFAHWLEKKNGTRVLYEIAVHSSAKRQGLGRKLIAHIGLPLELKTDYKNEESNRFYCSLGFIKVGHSVTRTGKIMAVYQKF